MAYTQQYSVNEAFLLFIWLDTSILTCVQWTFRRKGSVKGGTDLQHNKKGVVNYWREIEKELPLHSVRLQSISQIASKHIIDELLCHCSKFEFLFLMMQVILEQYR
ncbi:unnamed protein product [Rhizophagus irregularis]|nr:unnamed protein product [Rhizophagus irregularis]CAB5360786.1 unnamed protein product [Rhizophagus irregularis]